MAKVATVGCKKSVVWKTLQEFCPSDINVQVEILSIAKHLGTFTADDCHILDPSLKMMDLKPQVYGVEIKNLLNAGKIAFIRYVPSGRRETHGRPVGEYRYIWG